MTAEIINPGIVLSVLADETNIAADTYYYPDSDGLSMKEWDDLSLQYTLVGGVTMTVEVQQDLNSDTSKTWHDITKAGYDLVTATTGAASFVDLSGVVDFDGLNVMNFRVKAVTSDTSNSIYISARRKSNDR